MPSLSYVKHYRFGHPLIPDNMDWLRHMIRVRGISNVAVFGPDGVCVFNESGMGRDLDGFQKVIDKALSQCRSRKRSKSAYLEAGTLYPPAVKKRGAIEHEWMPALAAGPDGRLALAYVSDSRGTNDVLLKLMDEKGKWGKPIEIAASDADEYGPAVAFGPEGEVLVAFASNGAADRYDIHVSVVKNGKAGRAKRVTDSPDDAMAPSLDFDGRRVWLAWYEWRKMGDLSRDREVFAMRGTGSSWSKPVQVSPKDVPTYEDHADPVIRGDGKGGAFVAWAWDYHGTLPSKPPVDENSIFVRHIDARLEPGAVLAAGFRGEGRARDYAPSLVLDAGGRPLVAWDNNHKASSGYGDKALFVNRLGGEDFGEQFEILASHGPLCSPRLLRDPKGGIHLVYARFDRKWELWRCRVGPEGRDRPEKIPVRAKAPRYPSAIFDSDGRLHVAYVETDGGRYRVAVARAK